MYPCFRMKMKLYKQKIVNDMCPLMAKLYIDNVNKKIQNSYPGVSEL